VLNTAHLSPKIYFIDPQQQQQVSSTGNKVQKTFEA
jgi:hypothetical protein